MKKVTLFCLFMVLVQLNFGQNDSDDYVDLIKTADSLYRAKDYKNAATRFSDAFKANAWKGLPNDRYNAACSWALVQSPDSAFSQLYILATRLNFTNYAHITMDPDLRSLQSDSLWSPLLERILQNKELAEKNLNKPLVAILDSIYLEDQQYRQRIDEVEKKYGWASNEMDDLWEIIKKKDAINLTKVSAILDQYGWLGPDVVGLQGNSTLFLVIQHADQVTQEKYLPMMQEAVRNGNALGKDLALLEDRVALRQGKLQMYGSQIGRDRITKAYYVQPLADPDNVDLRRAELGLGPLSEYVKLWQIKWDVEQYKKDLPELIKKMKQ